MAKNNEQFGFDLNLALMEDEPLIVLAKECEYGPARDELIVRYGSQVERVIAWLAYPQGFSRADVEDARQNAVFWIVEAIKKYDVLQIGKPQGCSFRSFLHRVLIARFKDFAKHLRRIEGHYDRRTECDGSGNSLKDIDRKLNDPATIAEARESLGRLQAALKTLDRDSSRLWQLLADGHSLREIADRMNISYDVAKRRRRKLIEHLKLRLSPAHDINAVDRAVESYG